MTNTRLKAMRACGCQPYGRHRRECVATMNDIGLMEQWCGERQSWFTTAETYQLVAGFARKQDKRIAELETVVVYLTQGRTSLRMLSRG